MVIRRVLLFATMLSGSGWAFAQTYAPLVTMRVATPDGMTQEISARESGVATVTLKDGTVYEFRPTIHDEPFSKVTVSIFKAASSTDSTAIVGEVQATKGGPPVDSKSKPNFRISILKIEGPQATRSS